LHPQRYFVSDFSGTTFSDLKLEPAHVKREHMLLLPHLNNKENIHSNFTFVRTIAELLFTRSPATAPKHWFTFCRLLSIRTTLGTDNLSVIVCSGGLISGVL
jgi:hypothetical protein